MSFVQLWRFLLTLSLLLTLPMQGYAAARMVSCDAVLAAALAMGGKRTVPRSASDAHQYGIVPHDSHAMLADTSRVTTHSMPHALMSESPHRAMHDPSSGTHHGIASSGAVQHDGLQHGNMQGGTHDSAHSAGPTAHGTTCMSCTLCSPGATLTCVVPITSTFVSARVIPALLVAPKSVDLAHPERPPQAFLA
jgi:hypothetical protein